MASKSSGNTMGGGDNTGFEHFKSQKASKNGDIPEIYFRQTTDTQEFINQVKENKDNTNPDIAWHVDTPSPDDLENSDMYITSNGSTFAINRETHTLTALSARGNSPENMRAVVEASVDKGGTNFDSFEGNYGFYLHSGFVPVRWTNWNSEYNDYMKAQGWPGKETERIVWFEHNPELAEQMVKNHITMNEWATGDNYTR